MNAAFHAELIKLRRPRILAVTAALSLLFAVATSLSVVLSADDGSGLERAGGATEAFSIGLSFTGILVFVLFIANVAAEFSQGTFRTLLMRQPRRLSLLAGKITALLCFAAGLLAVVLALTWLVSTLVALWQGVETGAWLSADGLAAAADAYARVLLSWCAWATLGMALAVVVRSAPVALGVGIAWSGPFEHILQDDWSAAGDWFPGLLLEGVVGEGGVEARTVGVLVLYVALAAAAAAVTLRTRDIAA
ncbi:MAG: ABC transporter permease [Actinomycetota bacterium]|nr:ABC transporter permease [Actinomycetota bacterium]